jgi:hypothetical protein
MCRLKHLKFDFIRYFVRVRFRDQLFLLKGAVTSRWLASWGCEFVCRFDLNKYLWKIFLVKTRLHITKLRFVEYSILPVKSVPKTQNALDPGFNPESGVQRVCVFTCISVYEHTMNKSTLKNQLCSKLFNNKKNEQKIIVVASQMRYYDQTIANHKNLRNFSTRLIT